MTSLLMGKLLEDLYDLLKTRGRARNTTTPEHTQSPPPTRPHPLSQIGGQRAIHSYISQRERERERFVHSGLHVQFQLLIIYI